jgi:DNA polymerase III epsilon subunit-like protein
MNYNTYVIFDFETTHRNPSTCQPVQLGAVAIHGRKLEIIPNSEFNTLMRPVFDLEECERLNLDPLTQETIDIHGKTAEMLVDAPTPKDAWANFGEYVNQYNRKGDNWFIPIGVGYNNKGYDNEIVRRLCSLPPYDFGPKTDKFPKGTMLHPIKSLDVVDMMFMFMENTKEVNSLSANNLVRGWMGYKDPKGYAHDALADAIMTAEVFIRSMKMIRSACKGRKFKGCFA